ncbi:hypothetical protein NW768_009829 [Fusarium equiseti]|uniref:Myb-like domain-containing protein n=1 Tax=Fusarium equiseti TaxID=61235 RepID=A0ABQ8R295_FUSEQ|nr:hypothetical protein NW768_009829 [Fusarium equiseti]
MTRKHATSAIAELPGDRGKDLRVKFVTPSQAEFPSSEGTKSAGDESTASTWSSSLKNKKRKGKGKGKASRIQSSTENESSGETDEPSTDLNTAVKYSNPVVEDPNWSISEDYRLRSMKEAGETWRFISTSLCKSRNDVRARWKILERQAIASDVTTEPETDGATTEGESAEVDSIDETTSEDNASGQVDDSEKTSENGSEVDDDDDETNSDSTDDQDDTEEEARSIVKPKGKPTANTSSGSKWHNGPRNRKVANENKWAKARAKAKTEEECESPFDTAQDDTSESSSCPGYVDPEKKQQMKYLQDHIYSEMYPPEIHPQPDAYLSQRDCDLLATIDSKYKRSRWLEMQANFYNVTGRMVPLEAIRDRCERAEAQEEDRSAARKLERRIKRVETWIDGQTQGNSDE